MTRITTADDGTRCRVIRPLAEDERIPGGTYVLLKDGAFKTNPAFGECVHMGDHDGPGWLLEPLPFIPDWPGHRPEQYLTDNPETMCHEGDIIAYRETAATWTIERLVEMGNGRTLRDLSMASFAYLISRANPEHDAENTP